MRILLVTHRYPPLGVTGVERLSEQTALALAASGHQVTVLTRNASETPAFPKLHRITRRGVGVTIISGGGPLLGRFPKLGPVLERMFERLLIEVDPDVILVSHLLNHSPMYLAIAQRWGVPVAMELHDFYAACERAHLQRLSGELCGGPESGRACATHCFRNDTRAPERWALRTHMFRHALEQADAVICPSEFVAAYFQAAFGPALPPTHIIGNGVEACGNPLPSRRSTEGALHLAYVGVVGPHKGPHVIVEALRLARLPAARLSVFGQPIQPYFRHLAENAAAIPGLEYCAYGAFDPVELPLLLADVDAVVVPSLVWETYSIVAHEAMACGVPVIASRFGALPEVVRHGENGLLFEPGSAYQLAINLQILNDNRELANTLRAGIRRSDWISVEERTTKLGSVLTSLAAARGATAEVSPELQELSVLRDALLEAPIPG
jgi:glycosyltransferase involved in cell wall biosynthesis